VDQFLKTRKIAPANSSEIERQTDLQIIEQHSKGGFLSPALFCVDTVIEAWFLSPDPPKGGATAGEIQAYLSNMAAAD
jgi:hypothetical protein